MLRVLSMAAALGLGLLGCNDPRLRRTLPPDVRVDTYNQVSAAKTDVLWVVDNSGSMAPRQENLARNFQSFIQLFSQAKVDFRIAVTTSDIFVDQGKLRGTPKVLSPSTPNLSQAFASNIRVGTGGSAYEAGLQAALLALDTQREANAPKQAQLEACQTQCRGSGAGVSCFDACLAQVPFDFLRPDAFLYLVFVTDEEDRSGQDIRYYWRALETAKGVGNDGMVTTAAIIGDVPSNDCGATPGTRYQALSQLTGGEVGSICDGEFATTLRRLATNAVGLKRKFALSVAPNADTLQVLVRYPCGADDAALAGCAELRRETCAGRPAEAVELECVPARGGSHGWSYEPGNNLVYFAGDSLPGLNATVEIQYYEEGKGP